MLRVLFFCISAVAIKVNFFRNGVNFNESDGISVVLPDGYTDLGPQELVNNADWSGLKDFEPDEFANITIYDEQGETKKETSELEEGKNYYLVPNDRLFVWPHVRVGHKVTVSGIENPPSSGDIALESLGTSPRVFFVHNLMSEEEADTLIETNNPNLYKSTVGSGDDELIRTDEGRTSDNTWDSTSETAKAIISRVFNLLRIDEDYDQMDGLQLVRYKEKQFYNSHFDYLETESATEYNNMLPKHGGSNRFATLFLYLNDVEVGGQTAFPNAETLTEDQLLNVSSDIQSLVSSHKDTEDKAKIEEVLATGVGPLEKPMAESCYTKLSVKAKKTAAVLFYSLTPTWDFDPQSLHGGCPVLQGEKWGANLWVWNAKRNDPDQEKLACSIIFKNTFPQSGKLYWRTTFLEDIAAGATSHHNTYNTHLFRFEIDDKVVFTHKANSTAGALQHVDIDQALSAEFINDGPDKLGVYWVNVEAGSELFLNEVQPGGKSNHGTYLDHVFKFYNTRTKLAVFEHKMTGEKQKTVLSIDPAMYKTHLTSQPHAHKSEL